MHIFWLFLPLYLGIKPLKGYLFRTKCHPKIPKWIQLSLLKRLSRDSCHNKCHLPIPTFEPH